jgi:protocatechuate 3,4-dioxygenase beta subunit
MKNVKIFIVLILAIMFSASFAEKNPLGLPTSLRVTVLDKLGNAVEGATVTLYRNSGDYNKSENAVAGPAKSNEKGQVTFKKLVPKSYFIEVKKGDQSNYGEAEQTGVLIKGRTNKVNIIID